MAELKPGEEWVVTAQYAADHLKVNVNTIYKWVRAGYLDDSDPNRKPGQQMWITWDSVVRQENFLNKKKGIN